MRKQTTKTQNTHQQTLQPRILSSSELQQATGGDDVMKTRHETAKNAIGNIR